MDKETFEVEVAKAHSMDSFLEDIAERIGLDSDRLRDLYLQDDDWSFVVRCSAIIEVAMNQTLQYAVKPKAIGETLAKKGLKEKIELVTATCLIEPELAAALQLISQARNAAVHDMRAFNFKLRNHIAGLKDPRHFCATLARGATQPKMTPEGVEKNPRFAIWTAAIEAVTLLIPPAYIRALPAED